MTDAPSTSRLSDQDKIFISNHYNDVKKQIVKIVKRKKNIYSRMGHWEDVTDEILSNLPEVYFEFDKKINSSFVNFATDRCVFRFLDDVRTTTNHRLRRQKVISQIKDTIVKRQGFCDQDEWVRVAKKLFGLKKLSSALRLSSREESSDEHEYRDKRRSALEQIEWEDLKKNIVDKAYKKFPKNSRSHRICRLAITGNILAKAEGSAFKTIEQISEEVGINVTYASQLLNGKKFFELMEECEISYDKDKIKDKK